MGCDGSGQCSAVCPEGINVRQWVSIAKTTRPAGDAARPMRAAKKDAARRFRTMSHAVRLLASMQMPSEATVAHHGADEGAGTADVLFYTGCNVLKTSHIVFNVMDIMEALDISADVVGGPSHCCGVYQLNAADLPAHMRRSAGKHVPPLPGKRARAAC